MMFRKFILPLALSLVLSSCQDFVGELAEMHIELLNLQTEVNRLNTTTAGIAEIIAGIDNNIIDKIDEIIEDNVCIGYTISYLNGKTVRIYHGTDGKKGPQGDDGLDGKDGHSPIISIRQDSDEVWYWCVDGQWMTDASGKKIPVTGEEGITPLLRVEKGRWLISYDRGESWQDYGVASVGYGNSPILDVDYTSYENKVKFTLRDGTEFYVPKAEANIRLLCDKPSKIEIRAGKSIDIDFKVEGGTQSNVTADVMAGDMFIWKINPVSDNNCSVTLKAKSSTTEKDLFTVFINYGGKTWMKVFTVILSGHEERIDLSSNGTANCYIVDEEGEYCFNCEVQGCSTESVGKIHDAEVLWETFGTAERPEVGDIVSDIYYSDGKVNFTAAKDGNAVIAVKDASGKILWSWHIWVCKGFDPEDTAQEYYHNAGTMMDRNLGAISAEPGNVGALGLHYQWGRKDPFPGPKDANSSEDALTTITWPSCISTDSEKGTVAYATAHPTTYIVQSNNHRDWMYKYNNKLWESQKTKYDPCPNGWRVPDGGIEGIWAKALNYTAYRKTNINGDFTKGGIDFGSTCQTPLGDSPQIWYPVSGTKDSSSSKIYKVDNFGGYWTCSNFGDSRSYSFYFDLLYSGTEASLAIVGTTDNAYSHPIRCQAIND